MQNYSLVSLLSISSKIFERLFLIRSINLSKKTVPSVPINTDSGKLIHMSINFCLFTNLLVNFHLWKRAPNFWICQELLIGFGMKA